MENEILQLWKKGIPNGILENLGVTSVILLQTLQKSMKIHFYPGHKILPTLFEFSVPFSGAVGLNEMWESIIISS